MIAGPFADRASPRYRLSRRRSRTRTPRTPTRCWCARTAPASDEAGDGSESTSTSGEPTSGETDETDETGETGETGEDPSIWYDEALEYIPDNPEQELADFLAEHGGVGALGQQAVDALSTYLRVEDQPHQWFDLGTWPLDFEGLYEPDYYAEALYKRLWGASPPLTAKLRFKPPPSELFDWIDAAALVGSYARAPVENDWHQGEISDDGGSLRWLNAAGVSWGLSYAGGAVVVTGDDCPYESDFVLELVKDPETGDYTPQLAGFRFNGELYARQ